MKALRPASFAAVMVAVGVLVPVSLGAPPTSSPASQVPAPPATVSATAGKVMPLTSGWHYNQNTGIDVIGTKLNVTDILVTGYTESPTGNSAAEVYDTDGVFNWYSPFQPWYSNPSGLVLSAGWDYLNLTLPNGDNVCARWVGPGAPLGNPCVQIHS